MSKELQLDDSLSPQPELAVCQNIFECIEHVCEYIVEKIDLSNLSQNLFSINVPTTVHPLLEARFDNQWLELSRSIVFDVFHAVFIQKVDELGYLDTIVTAIKALLPDRENDIKISRVDIFDEPEVDVTVTSKMTTLDGDVVSTEGTRQYQYSGNSITVELVVEMQE